MTMTTNTKTHTPTAISAVSRATQCTLHKQQKTQLSLRKTRYSIQFLLHYWPSKLSKADDFYFIRNGVCHFLLLINSKLGRISHHSLYTIS